MNIATNVISIEEKSLRRRDRWRQEALDTWRFKLWFWQKLWLRLGGRIYIRHEQLTPGTPDTETALYLFYCPHHDIVDMDYPHTDPKPYHARLDCSLCDLEFHEPPIPAPTSPPEPLAA